MKTVAWAWMVVSLVGCSSSGDSDSDEPCSIEHRKGTYLQHLSEHANGSCGPIGDQVIQTGGELTLPDGCAYDVPDAVSDDQCKLTRQYTCPLDGKPGGANYTVITTEEGGGSKLTGVISITVRDANGDPTCASTYDLTITRQ